MSTCFESNVYFMEQSAPFAGPKAIAFMNEQARYGGHATLKVRYRSDVASRLWFTLEWREHPDAKLNAVCGQTAEKTFWRAIQVHKDNQRENFAARVHEGYNGGDGI